MAPKDLNVQEGTENPTVLNMPWHSKHKLNMRKHGTRYITDTGGVSNIDKIPNRNQRELDGNM